MDDNQFQLVPLSANHNVNNIKTGDERFVPLKNFLKKQALIFHDSFIAKTYVITDSNEKEKVIGYITLITSQIDISGVSLVEGLPGADTYDYFPAIKIARLLVDKRCRGQRIGETLIDFALYIAEKRIMPAVGCRFLIVDSKPEAVDFYKKCGFELIDTPENLKSDAPILCFDLAQLVETEIIEEDVSEEELSLM